MYHERGIRQADIADSPHLSQARVSRLLKRAAETGIVRTVVVVPRACTPTSRRRSRAVRAARGGRRRRRRRRPGHHHRARLGGGAYLESTLTGGERIGISSWSQTLLSTVDRMRPFRTRGRNGHPIARRIRRAVRPGAGQPAARRVGRDHRGEAHFPARPRSGRDSDIRKNLLADPAIAEVAASGRP